jgi:metal-dependent amidase/aminoacylase/carboxypeptidase family protein
MPQKILNLLSKMSKRELQMTIAILSICVVTGGSAYNVLSDQIVELDNQLRAQEIEQAKRDEKIRSMYEKISQIHDHIVRKGLEAGGSNSNPSTSPRIH